METKPDFSNTAYLFPHINKEGIRFGVIAVIVAAGITLVAAFFRCALLSALVPPMWLLAYGVFLFFRDPERYPPADGQNAVLSPADGRICLIQEVPLPEELKPEETSLDDWNKVTFTRVSVFMSVFNVHVNRMPTAGTIVRKAYVPGKYLNASLDKASKDNERCAYLIETADGTRYGVVQLAGLVARRIVPFVEEGAVLGQAERFGLIRFGSRLDVYLPQGAKPAVRVGQIMVAGETILAHLS
jgi:phosphatidylserine decarboxylase